MAVVETDPDVGKRLNALLLQGKALEIEGLPFPTAQVGQAVDQAMSQGNIVEALEAVERGETLYRKAVSDWQWLRGLLDKMDALRSLAMRIGIDVDHLTSRVGDPRAQLREGPLSSGMLEKVAANASRALAVLSDAIPTYCVQQARDLGETIRAAEKRGEDVGQATDRFKNLLRTLREEHGAASAQALLELRGAVLRIPKAPVIAEVPPDEEEEILNEARSLARRLHRIKGRARDAHSAARLMAEVRAALSEDRRYGSPEEEIEELWKEVDRLTRERQLSEEPGVAPEPEYAGAADGPIDSLRFPPSRPRVRRQ